MLWRRLKTACHHSLMHIDHFLKDVDQWQSNNPVWCLLLLFTRPLPRDGSWRETMEPQKPGNFPGSGPEVIERQRESPKSERRKEFVAGQCRMR